MPASDHSDPPTVIPLGGSQSLPRICFGDLGDPIAVRTLQGRQGRLSPRKARLPGALLARRGTKKGMGTCQEESDLKCHHRSQDPSLSRSRPSLSWGEELASELVCCRRPARTAPGKGSPRAKEEKRKLKPRRSIYYKLKHGLNSVEGTLRMRACRTCRNVTRAPGVAEKWQGVRVETGKCRPCQFGGRQGSTCEPETMRRRSRSSWSSLLGQVLLGKSSAGFGEV